MTHDEVHDGLLTVLAITEPFVDPHAPVVGFFLALWIGAVLVLVGVALSGLGADRAWFPGAALVDGLGLLFVLNVVDPEAIVVRHNVDRATEGRPIDPDYLAQLSDDAVPALVSALPRLPGPERTHVLAAVCGRSSPSFEGWAAANTSRRRAVDARRQVCRSQGVMR